nr:unnamed protein product [Spirometra erinaceieuropaei]
MDMELVFRAIEERVFLTDYRAIRRLYTQKGERIRSPNQIEDKLDIVAAGREPFRPTAYGSPLPRLSVSPSRKITKYADVEFLNILPIVQHHLLHCAHRHCSRDYQEGNCQRNQEMNVTSNAGQAGHHFAYDPNSAATLIQAQYRGYRTRKTLAGIHQQAAEGSEGDASHRHHFAGDRDSAATLIQAKYRGYRTRKSLAAMQHQQAAKVGETEASHGHHFLGDRDSAATLIQASYRGYRTRKSLGFRPSRANEENQAEGYQKMNPDVTAAERQTRPHGYDMRTHQAKGLKDISNQSAMGDDKRPLEDVLNRAATTIQASFRGYHVRRELQKHDSKHAYQSSGKQQVAAPSPDELEAAKKIQAAFRGYRVRKQFRSQTTPISPVSSGYPDLDDSKYVAAATKIQASYRGYRTRKSSNFHRSSVAPIASSAKK